MTQSPLHDPARLSTGIEGLDHILGGGLPENSLYLIEGSPGVGKTTLALQFLLEGARQRERGLFITLSETARELDAVARSHGWEIGEQTILELGSMEHALDVNARYTVFHPAEVELDETTQRILAEVELCRPARVVLDSLSEMRLLAQSSLRFRRQILALKQFLLRHGCTVMLLDNLTTEVRDLQLHSLAHGVIVMERNAPVDGGVWRHLQVLKLRGISFYEGCHDFAVRTGGLEVFPRIRRTTAYHRVAHEVIPSGVEGLDSLLGGGLDRGTATLILGPTGTGKSSLTSLYATAFARRGERVASYVFDENLHTKLIRARSLGLDLEALQDQGWLSLSQVNANETSPGELCHRVHQAVVQDGVRLVVIDGLNGYLHAPMQKDISAARMHDLLGHLGQQGVTTLLVVGQHGVLGSNMETPVDLSYMADTVLLLRYFEAAGQVRRAISVLKKRTGRHERTIREFWIGERCIEVGGTLRDLHGVMTGVPSASAPEYASAWELDENGTG